MPNRFKVLFGALLITLCACTPIQYGRYVDAKMSSDPVVSQAADDATTAYLAEKAEDTAGRPCADAYDYFREAGFDRSQWPTMARLCWRESNDTLTAVSRSHDYCWWQINRSAHERRLIALGIVSGSITELLTDPQKCANAAHDVWVRAGYTAWVTY